MSPMHTQEYVVFERIQDRQNEVAQQRLLTPLRQGQTTRLHHMMNKIGTFFIAFGIKTRRID